MIMVVHHRSESQRCYSNIIGRPMFSKVNKSGCFNHGRASSIRITRMFIEHNRTPKFSKVFKSGCFNHGSASSIRITRMFIEHNRTSQFSKVSKTKEKKKKNQENIAVILKYLHCSSLIPNQPSQSILSWENQPSMAKKNM